MTITKGRQGFASMESDRQREIASKGGTVAHQCGVAHEWTSEEAREAGRKGGLKTHENRRIALAAASGGTVSVTTGK